MVNFSLREFRGKVPAHGQLDFAVYGDKVFAVNVPNGCKIKFDNGEAVLFRTGIRFGVNGWFVSTINRVISVLASVPVIHDVALKVANAIGSNVFSKISIVNDTSEIVNVEFLAGFGDISDDSTIVENTIESEIVGSVSTYPTVGNNGVGNYTMGRGNGANTASFLAFPAKSYGYVFLENTRDEAVPIYIGSGSSPASLVLQPNETLSYPFANYESRDVFCFITGDSTPIRCFCVYNTL